MADIEYRIEREGLPPIRLDTDGGGPYGLQAGSRGFGVGPLAQRWTDSAGDGARLDGERVGGRILDLGLLFLGTDRLDTGALIRDFVNLTRYRRGTPLARLVAQYSNGQTFDIPVVYSSGLELDMGDALPQLFAATVALSSPDAYWTDRAPVEFFVVNGAQNAGLLPDLAALQVSQSVALGSLEIDNSGDVDSEIVWILRGPTTRVVCERSDGRGFTIETPIADGETFTVNTATKRVTDNTGANRYADLGPAPKFLKLPAGRSYWTLTADGAGPNTRLAGYAKPRREVIY